MRVFFSALQGVLEIVIIIAIGYLLTHKRWFEEKTADLFAKIVLNLSLPLGMIVNISSFFTKNDLINSAKGLIIPFLSILISYFLGYFLALIFKTKKGRRGLLAGIFSLSNSIFIGLPMSQALFGEIATPYTLLYYMANTTIWWSLGVYGIILDTQEKKEKIFNIETLKRILNPPFLGFLVGVGIVIMDLKLPKFLFDSFKLIGNLTTPLSLFYVSIIMYKMGFEKFKLDKDAILTFLGRFLITPLLVILLEFFIPIPKLMRDVFIIMSAMPVMVNSAIVARMYGGDYEFAVSMITYTTLFSIIIMPLYMVLLSKI
ncbi:MAG: AEC family transporter [Dictyoglomus thermophilum]|uniref:AEC family transporter n=1 Tax=Dictyoglomus thermophilum TaxID=14 RepID=A0A7C2CUF8_DICTH|nr:AEC family transporter [Dictyoglomus thermophilum]MCX7720098.1 AEC family transporter [Dictyoglomus thermophilum]TYT23428.1 AEC family transporter [Dictyoglomus thermophilum]